jgi:hypothetical protein
MTTKIKLPKTAKNNTHFFEVVLKDLYTCNNTVQILPFHQKTFWCKTANGNLKYDGLNIYSYNQLILYKDEFGICNLDIEVKKTLDKNTKDKIQKHFKDLWDILEKEGYDFELGLNIEDDDIELLKTNPKRNWLFNNIKCSLEEVKDTCSIDLEEYDTLVKTECGHMFKDENLYGWLYEHNNKTCPLCRTKLF